MDDNKITFQGEHSKILFVQDETSPIYDKIIKYLVIPPSDYGIVRISKKEKQNKAEITKYVQKHSPKLIISIGSTAFHIFMENKKLKEVAGKLQEINNDIGQFIYCPLFNPARYQHIKFANEYKQLDNLKKYLMRNYEYGFVKNH